MSSRKIRFGSSKESPPIDVWDFTMTAKYDFLLGQKVDFITGSLYVYDPDVLEMFDNSFDEIIVSDFLILEGVDFYDDTSSNWINAGDDTDFIKYHYNFSAKSLRTLP
jgi:hypothetical protein